MSSPSPNTPRTSSFAEACVDFLMPSSPELLPSPPDATSTPENAYTTTEPEKGTTCTTAHNPNPESAPAPAPKIRFEHSAPSPAAHIPLSQRLQPSLVLQNSGSTARDHLASERTFLAYVRTSLALASTGVALVQLFTIADLSSASSPAPHLRRFARPLGSTTVLMGILVLIIGFTRYFTVQTALTQGRFPTARSCIVFITFVLTAIVAITFGALLSGRTKAS